jgi:hypothetical protein
MARQQITTTVSASRQSYGGPFLSGDVYAVVIDASAGGLAVFSASDPFSTWAEQDGSGAPTLGVHAYWAILDGTDILIASIRDNSNNADIAFHKFSTSSDTWTFIDRSVKSNPTRTPPDVQLAVSLHKRTTGELVILANTEQERIKGVDFGRVSFYRSSDEYATAPTETALDAGGELEYGGVCGLSVGNRVHALYSRDQSDPIHRTIRADNSLSSETDAGTLPGSADREFGQSASYDDDGTIRCRMPMSGFLLSVRRTRIASFDDGDSPTVSDITAVNNGTSLVLDSAVHSCAVDSKTVHLLWSETVTQDIFRDSNNDDAGWGSDLEVEDGVTATSMHSNVYTRGSSVVLAYFYEDTGVWYNEVVLSTAVSNAAAAIWESLAELASPRIAPWESLAQASASDAALWESLASAERALAALWESGAGVSNSAAAIWMAAGTVKAVRAALWESLAAAALQRAAPWESSASLSQAEAALWEAFGFTASARAAIWMSAGRASAQRTALWESLAPVDAALAARWESSAPVSVQLSALWESLAEAAAAAAALWEAAGFANSARATLWESLADATATRDARWESLSPAESPLGSLWESLAPAVSARPALWEAKGSASAARAALWESVAPLSAARVARWESLATASASLPVPWESLAEIVSPGTALWQARGFVAAQRQAAWEAFGIVSASAAAPWESLASAIKAETAIFESLAGVKATRIALWESLLGVVPGSSVELSMRILRSASRLMALNRSADILMKIRRSDQS